jgi:4a-hydroxytetrahydrobiopterin dehydratase
MNQVAAECTKQKHHPEWSNVYNKTHIRWTTHSPEGLSAKDLAMARFCDDAADRLGELDAEPDEYTLAADGKVEAGDCCLPRGGQKNDQSAN